MADDDESKSREGAESEILGINKGAETKKESKQPKDGWDKLQALSPLISGVVLAVFGYILTGSVNQTIQKGQLQFSYVKEMQELLTKLGDPKISPEESKTAAVALAGFGSYAIPSLINEIESGELNRPIAGEYGLRSVALADPTNACPILGRVLDNETAAYNWLTHRAAIRILGTADCRSQQLVLTRYKSRLDEAASSSGGFRAYQVTLADEPRVTRETVDQLRLEIDRTLKTLRRGSYQE